MRLLTLFFISTCLFSAAAHAQHASSGVFGFARYMPNENVNADAIPNDLLNDIFTAFERLEPTRPPKFVSHQLSKLIVNIKIEIGSEFFLERTGESIVQPTTFRGKVTHTTDYTLKIPMAIQAINHEARVTELAEFLKSAFPVKMVKRAVASELLNEWATRLQSQGRLPKAKSGNVIPLFKEKTCEQLFAAR